MISRIYRNHYLSAESITVTSLIIQDIIMQITPMAQRTLAAIQQQTGFVATILYGGLIPRTGKVAAFA